MARVTITLPHSAYRDTSDASGSRVIWGATAGSRPSIDAELSASGDELFFNELFIYYFSTPITNLGRTGLSFAGTQTGSSFASGQDLSAAMETSGTITLEASNGDTVDISLGADTSEPYTWIPSNVSALTGFINTLRALSDRSLKITLDDNAPPTPSRGSGRVTVTLPNRFWVSIPGLVAFTPGSGSYVSIGSDVTASGMEEFIVRLDIPKAAGPGNLFSLSLSRSRTSGSTSGAALSAQMLLEGTITLVASNGSQLVVSDFSSDPTNGYRWTPSNIADVYAFGTLLGRLSDRTLTVTFDDNSGPTATADHPRGVGKVSEAEGGARTITRRPTVDHPLGHGTISEAEGQTYPGGPLATADHPRGQGTVAEATGLRSESRLATADHPRGVGTVSEVEGTAYPGPTSRADHPRGVGQLAEVEGQIATVGRTSTADHPRGVGQLKEAEGSTAVSRLATADHPRGVGRLSEAEGFLPSVIATADHPRGVGRAKEAEGGLGLGTLSQKIARVRLRLDRLSVEGADALIGASDASISGFVADGVHRTPPRFEQGIGAPETAITQRLNLNPAIGVELEYDDIPDPDMIIIRVVNARHWNTSSAAAWRYLLQLTERGSAVDLLAGEVPGGSISDLSVEVVLPHRTGETVRYVLTLVGQIVISGSSSQLILETSEIRKPFTIEATDTVYTWNLTKGNT